ncbi:MAG: hypothetical protein KKA79_05700 [Nanoarchaeota archaeon]|nr:hypothetical protein [Nanoarchaeota archaeon]MCG2718979.1 hypothetical protein [Nanoarchaeota archaeon]
MVRDIDTSQGQVIRADHLFHVTLKYTRTGDVVKHIIKRLLNSLEYTISEILEKKNVKDIPTIALIRADVLKKKFPKNKDIQELIKFYLYLKKIDKGKYVSKEEYRKGVAIVVDEEDINIPRLRELLGKAKEFVRFADDF